MKILYGIQTTGSGHLSRALSVAHELIQAGHQVDGLLSGPQAGSHWDLSIFDSCQQLPGLSFEMVDGKVSNLRTLKKLQLKRFIKDVKQLDLSGYDLVLNDFEPISAWAAKRQKITSISLSNQASFKYSVPQTEPSIADKFVMKYFAPCKHYIGLGWHHFNSPILPPIVDIKALELKTIDDDHVLAYLPYDEPQKTIAIFNQVPEVPFKLYGPFEQQDVFGNVTLCPLSRAGFLKGLASCKGLITNAGFASVSEAFYLGKKVLVNPIKGQFEQESNAKMIEALGLGKATEKLDSTAITDWYSSQAIAPMRYPNVAKTFAQWLERADWSSAQSLEALTQTLWPN
ncbi:MAG: glycosyltransferase [Gammaproteobacteria bacterium]|nr:glycosyltransferase [Gammaproteobacteria bacterium]